MTAPGYYLLANGATPGDERHTILVLDAEGAAHLYRIAEVEMDRETAEALTRTGMFTRISGMLDLKPKQEQEASTPKPSSRRASRPIARGPLSLVVPKPTRAKRARRA